MIQPLHDRVLEIRMQELAETYFPGDHVIGGHNPEYCRQQAISMLKQWEQIKANDDPTIENSFEEPRKVVPEMRAITDASKEFRYKAPAYSINILRLHEKK